MVIRSDLSSLILILDMLILQTDGLRVFLLIYTRQYTVLFVGYSHTDPVVPYLARGLRPGTIRYALVMKSEEGDYSHWKRMGITPVPYPQANECEEHQALYRAIHAWAEHVQMGSLDHMHKVRLIAESGPPLEPEGIDYVHDVLAKPELIQHFVRYARGDDWLRWVEQEHFARALFQPTDVENEVTRKLADWIARNYVAEHPGETLALIHRQGGLFGQSLWKSIASELGRDETGVHEQLLVEWVVLLLQSKQPSWKSDLLEGVLLNCQYPEDTIAAELLFEHLLTPHAETRPGFRVGSDDTNNIWVELVTDGDPHALWRVWESLFTPHLDMISEALEPFLTTHLINAHRVLCAFGQADDYWDASSLARSAIEEHKEDAYKRFERSLAILIDAARGVIQSLLITAPHNAHMIIDRWGSSRAQLLKRLAVYAITESAYIDSDTKLKWIMERKWLYASDVRHEVFRLLEVCLPICFRSCTKGSCPRSGKGLTR